MATVALLGTATWTTAVGNKTVTATPAVDDLIVVVAGTSGLAGGTTAVSDDQSGTYVQVDQDRTGFSTTGVLTVWVRTALVPAASSTVFTASQAGSTGGGLAVFHVSGMTRTGAAAVRGNGGQSTGGAGTTPAPVLNLTPLTGNAVITAVANGTNPAGVTTPASFTRDVNSGYNTPATGLNAAFRNSGQTSATITWGGTSASAFASVAIELNTAGFNNTAPTLAAYGETDWTTEIAQSTSAVSWLTGDRIVVVGMTADSGTALGNPTNANLSFTPGTPIADANSCWANSWSATAGSDQTSQQIAFADPGAVPWGAGVWVFRGSDGLGTRVTDSTTAKTASLTRSDNKSAVVTAIGDWSAGTTTSRVWTPTGETEREATQVAGQYTVFVANWGDQGAAGATSYGITGTASTGAHTNIVLEILGTVSGAIEQTATDSVGLTDAAVFTQSLDRTDSIGLTDSIAFTEQLERIDAAGLTDTSTIELVKLVEATDQVGLTDSAVFTEAFDHTDQTGLTDTATPSATFDRTATDQVGLTDATTIELVKLVSVTDSTGLTDSASTAAVYSRTQNDPVGLTDAVTAAFTFNRAFTDQAGITDTISAGILRALEQTDQVGLTDAAAFAAIWAREFTDLVGLTDSTVLGGSATPAGTGTMTPVDQRVPIMIGADPGSASTTGRDLATAKMTGG